MARTPLHPPAAATMATAATTTTTTTIIENPLAVERRVSWGQVDIHEFPIILGDNPSCSPPLTIDWTPQRQIHTRVDVYEFTKATHCLRAAASMVTTPRKRRSRTELRIKDSDRSAILLRSGVSVHDIIDESIEGDRIRKSRQENMKGRRFDTFRKVFVKATRRLQKNTSGRAAGGGMWASSDSLMNNSNNRPQRSRPWYLQKMPSSSRLLAVA